MSDEVFFAPESLGLRRLAQKRLLRRDREEVAKREGYNKCWTGLVYALRH